MTPRKKKTRKSKKNSSIFDSVLKALKKPTKLSFKFKKW